MATDSVPSGVVEQHEQRRGRTIIDLKQQSDGEWVATQHEVAITGHGGSALAAVIDYCQRLQEGRDGD